MIFGREPSMQEILGNQRRIADAHNRLEVKMSEYEQKQFFAFVKELQVLEYNNGKSYARIVIAVGYASFFALWSSLKGDLSQMTMLVSGLAATVSVILFMASEVYNMISSAIHFRRVSNLLSQGVSQKTVEDIKELTYQFSNVSQQVWLCFLIPTILMAALGAMFLLTSFAWGIYDELFVDLQG